VTAPVINLLLAQSAKQQCNQIDEDVQLFPINLNIEGFVSNLHLVVSFLPLKLQLWGLVALSATCAQGRQATLSTALQPVTPERKQLPTQNSSAEVA
jgi:hypothetical protein